jgi:hypothetical protein
MEGSMKVRASLTGAAAVTVVVGAALAADSANTRKIPIFATGPNTGWVLDRAIGPDDLIQPPEGGPGPVTYDRNYPYVPNGNNRQSTYRVADLTNPILQEWLKPSMKNANDDVIAGKVPFRARERCWPVGVPGFDAYSLVEPFYFYQSADKITVINQGGPEIRRIYLNVPHSKDVKPSWYGESVGHYENGDTLVIDTIGQNDKAFVDAYRTPHTTQIHVTERWKLAADGQSIDVTVYVEDPGAFTTPWKAVQRWRRVETAPIQTVPCNENNGDFFNHGLVPLAEATTPDF